MNRGKCIMHSLEDTPCWSKKSKCVRGRSEIDVYPRDKRFQQLASHWTTVCLMKTSETPQNNFTCAIVPQVPEQHVRIKAFYGTSKNAVKTQIWIAIYRCTHFRNSYVGTKLMICEKTVCPVYINHPAFFVVLEYLKCSYCFKSIKVLLGLIVYYKNN